MKKNQNNKKVILVVEDERPLFEAVKIKFEKSDFSVVVTRRVEEALDYLENSGTADVIWLDHYLLGKEDGLDFVVKLKSDERWRDLPVFVVSNTASSDKVQSYMKLGVDKYYVKAEHRLDEIINEVKAFLKKKSEE